MCLNISQDMWMVEPLPLEAQVSLPGCAFASAMSSFTEFAFTAGLTTSTLRTGQHDHRGEVLVRIVGQIVVQERSDAVQAARGHEQGVAVRLGSGNHFGAEVRAGARAIVHVDRLAKRSRNLAPPPHGQ